MGLYFSISALIIMSLFSFNFFLKKRVKNIETTIYKYLLILTLIGLSLDIITGIMYNLGCNPNNFFYNFGARIVFLYFIIWTSLFAFYIKSIGVQGKKKYYNIINKSFVFFAFIIIVSSLIVFIFPVEFLNYGNVIVPSGIPVSLAYTVAGLLILYSIYLAVKYHKNIPTKKMIPLYIFCILMITNFIIQRLYPELFLINYLISLVVMIMYFTIENPDVKMIEQLNYERDRADKANRAKTDFLSSMSHEIRTPLNAIVGFSQGLKEENLPPAAMEEVDDIIEASETLLDTVNGILDISKIEANKIEIVNTTYDFHKVFDELVALSKARLGDDRPIEFRYSIAEDTPQYLYGDYARVKQVVLNFLTNAIKYTNEGYIEFNVRNITNNGICRLIMTVEDSGIGIKKESINKLFDRFERLDNENSTIEGTGLGMAITKKLVELMHGKIIVQSIYGKGSQFMVILDQKVVDAPAIEVKDKDVNKELSSDLSDKKILIVDDNKMNLKVAARLLKPFNINVTQIESGFECLDLIKAGNTYDLILMDDMMPKKSGKETFKELKADPSFNIPVVILTANAISGMKEEYLAEGFDDYLAKPIEKAELNRVLKKYLG